MNKELQIKIDQNFIDSLPDKIEIPENVLKKKTGNPGTIASRRKSKPVQGRVRGRRNHFTDEEKLNCVCVYAVTGNARRAAEITKIPEGTIRSWKTTEWWNVAMSRVEEEKDDEINSKLTALIDKAVDAVNDRLENGDYIYDSRNGTLVRVPVKAKDLTVVTAIAVDKRELLRGKPTQRIEKVSADSRLDKLQADFRKFALAQEVVQELEVFEDEEDLSSESSEIEETETSFDSEENDVLDVQQTDQEEDQEDTRLTINEMFSEG